MSALVEQKEPDDNSLKAREEESQPAVVLVVDDEPDVRTLVIQRFLQKDKVEIDSVSLCR